MIVAFVDDLLDRSRLSEACGDVRFVRSPSEAGGADIVVVDLVRYRDALAQIRSVAPGASIVAFGPHVDLDVTAARNLGVDVVMPRSRFFRDPAAALRPGPRRSTPG